MDEKKFVSPNKKRYPVCIGKTSFESFIKLDFERNRSIYNIFNQDLSVRQIIRDIEIFVEQKKSLVVVVRLDGFEPPTP